jgi:hypothetical protein
MSDKELWRPDISDAVYVMDMLCEGVDRSGNCEHKCDECLIDLDRDITDERLSEFKGWIMKIISDTPPLNRG